ncbi:MAG: CsgG/HfaB family protein, partial [Armatimonadota bacterium]
IPALAVLDFHSEGAAGELDRHLAELADLLSANLTAFDVPLVERQKLSAILAELGLSASGLVRVADMAKVGRLLGAERMLDTSMIVSGSMVVFDSQVIQPETGMVVASCRASGEQQRLPAVVQELATKVAEALRVPITDAGRQALAQQATGSLEAALHAAAGWRLGEAGQAEEAAREYQQAVYLDPSAAWWWDQLGQQYQALDQMDRYAETMHRFLAAAQDKVDRRTLGTVALSLADAQIWRAHAAESEAAARLALQYYDDGGGDNALIRALAEQAKFQEGRRFCEALVRRKDVPHDRLVSAWDVLMGWFAWPVSSDPTEDHIKWELSNIARALDLFPDGDAMADSCLPANLTDGLLMTVLGTATEPLRLDVRSSHLEDGLALAHRMAERTRDRSVPGRGWFLVGVLNYKLGRPGEAIAALGKCVRDYPEISYDTGHQANDPVGSANGIVHYVMGRVYQDQLKERERAVASYQRALMILDPERDDAKDALARLKALGGSQSPSAPWLRRVGGLGQRLQNDNRWRAANWLRGQGYDLRLPSSAPMEAHLAGEGVQILIWEGRTSDYPSADQLRSYVAGGGNLLVCLGSQPSMVMIGPTLATTSGTTDLGLNWLLPAFAMEIEGRALESDSAQLSAASPPWFRIPAQPASYSGVWFPLRAAGEATSLRIRDTRTSNEVSAVAAGETIGLGKVVVVSLRDWFVGADSNDLAQWQFDLLRGTLDWFGKPDLPQRYPQAAQHWAAARNLAAVGEYGAAVQELDKVDVGVPSAADARYSAACLLADKVGDVDGAVRRWREVIASKDADTWLLRMAHLRLEIAAVRAGDERTATQELTQAAGEHPDGIWGQAWVAAGDLKLAQGDYLGAAQSFRSVADELGHSEERLRALFGLAYALNKQGKPEAAARVFDSVAAEFGKAPLPADMDQRWPDPWQTYFPRELRKQEPTVADAVAAAGPKL